MSSKRFSSLAAPLLYIASRTPDAVAKFQRVGITISGVSSMMNRWATKSSRFSILEKIYLQPFCKAVQVKAVVNIHVEC